MALTVGLHQQLQHHDFRIFESTARCAAAQCRLGWLRVGALPRALREHQSDAFSGMDEASLVQIGEQPAMRHYVDGSNRTRNRFVGQVDLVPTEALTFSVSGGVGSDEFADKLFGLQDAGFAT